MTLTCQDCAFRGDFSDAVDHYLATDHQLVFRGHPQNLTWYRTSAYQATERGLERSAAIGQQVKAEIETAQEQSKRLWLMDQQTRNTQHRIEQEAKKSA